MQPPLSPQLTPRIVVDQPVALYAPLSIALEGFAPRTRVTRSPRPGRSRRRPRGDRGQRSSPTMAVGSTSRVKRPSPEPGRARRPWASSGRRPLSPERGDRLLPTGSCGPWSRASTPKRRPAASAELTVERRLAGGGVSRRPVREAGVVGTLFLPLASFGATDLPSELANVPVEYFEHAVSWMRREPWLPDGFLLSGERRGAANWRCYSGQRSRRSTP